MEYKLKYYAACRAFHSMNHRFQPIGEQENPHLANHRPGFKHFKFFLNVIHEKSRDTK